jgi:hypothetical protein
MVMSLVSRLPTIVVVLLLLAPGAASAQTDADRAAIRAAALDYIEGWYTGNAERMERAVHPELAKRIVQRNPNGRSFLDQQSAMTLVQNTRGGGGKQTPEPSRLKE